MREANLLHSELLHPLGPQQNSHQGHEVLREPSISRPTASSSLGSPFRPCASAIGIRGLGLGVRYRRPCSRCLGRAHLGPFKALWQPKAPQVRALRIKLLNAGPHMLPDPLSIEANSRDSREFSPCTDAEGLQQLGLEARQPPGLSNGSESQDEDMKALRCST